MRKHQLSLHVAHRPCSVIAHRGASRHTPENTVAAFELARTLHADAVELDVRLTHDRLLAVHHDARLADGRAIADVRAGDLPAHVPLLERALQACNGMWVNVEIKFDESDTAHDPNRSIADIAWQCVERAGWAGGVLFSAFDRSVLERLRKVAPDSATGWLLVGATSEHAQQAAAAGHCALHPHHSSIDAALVAACHERGLRINAWTVDEPAEMQRLIALGVDGICTNVPDVLVAQFPTGTTRLSELGS